MSKTEKKLLEEEELSYADLARYLRVSRQAVQRGIEESENRYLTPERVAQIYACLQTDKNKPEGSADRFRHNVLTSLDINADAFAEVPTFVTIDHTLDSDHPGLSAKEMWVFSSRPRELDPDYRLEMTKKYFTIVDDETPKIRRIVYFIPPDISYMFCSAIRDALANVEPSKKNRIAIVESPAIRLSPHFVIFDPLTTPDGRVRAEVDKRFIRMSSQQTAKIVEYLRNEGVGIHKTKVLMPTSPKDDKAKDVVSNTLRLHLCFDSLDEVDV